MVKIPDPVYRETLLTPMAPLVTKTARVSVTMCVNGSNARYLGCGILKIDKKLSNQVDAACEMCEINRSK